MNWLKVNKDEFEKVQSINPKKGIYLINLSPRPYSPIENEEEGVNTQVFSIKVNKMPNTVELKQLLLDLQAAYDKGEEVNTFNLGEQKCWLDKETRVGLINSITIQKDSGVKVTTLWLNGEPYKVSVDYALEFLRGLELYAVNCYNVTQSHIAEIKAISGREELFEYDVTKGYPEVLSFNMEEVIEI